MIEIPIGKPFMAIESMADCHCLNCDFDCDDMMINCDEIACTKDERSDGKNVVFKFVDYKEIKQ